MKIKIASVCMAFALTLTLSGQCFAASTPFTDLENTNAKEKILSLQAKGYANGIADGVFAPHETMTAAQGIQLIVKALGLNLDTIRFVKEPKATDYFKKANNDSWYAHSLIVASVNGFDLSSDMDPNQEWTHEEFTYHLIQIMEKHANLPMIKLVPTEIADQDQMESSYSGAIERALAYNIVTLDTNGKFNPKVNITRAEAAEQVYNALEYINAHAPKPVVITD